MDPSTIDPGAVLATVAVFAVVVRAAVQAIRRQWPAIDGLWVQLIALALGAGAAWAFDLQGAQALLEYVNAPAARIPSVWLDYIVTGGAIAATAGFFHEAASSPPATVVEVDENGAPL